MSLVVGIDLGTTNSCLAISRSAPVPGLDRLVEQGLLLPLGDALVLAPRRSPTVPSAVWISPDGVALVGRQAKELAKVPGQPPPALYFKRLMGTSEQVTAGHAVLTPEAASAHVLRHLKETAQEILGVPIHRAVVTVPAFFEMSARNATTAAGELAGLEVVDTLLEPVAAAFAYTHQRRPADPATFLVYDLGGGTFDVSVVTWDPESDFDNPAFDGDAYLGGYDFDRAIANRLGERLAGLHDLSRLDPDDPDDRPILYRMLSFAEDAKKQLSLPDGTETTIIDSSAVDRQGVPVDVFETFTREEFESLIADRVERTLTCCDRALAASGLPGFDEILMVGGSSYIPLVRRSLHERFGTPPRLIDPNLCVAAGAAIKAARLGTYGERLFVDAVPLLTGVPAIDVTGRVTDGLAGTALELAFGDGRAPLRTETGEAGGFLFADVELVEGANPITVRLASGSEQHAFEVVHSPSAPPPPPPAPGDVLSHDVSIAVVGGFEVAAPAGTKLPYRTTGEYELAVQRGGLEVSLFEGHSPIGRVHVLDLPLDLPIGTPVLVELTFNRGWRIDAVARVPEAGRAAVGTAVIEIPRVEVPSWEELESKLATLTADWEELSEHAAPAQRLVSGPQIDELIDRLEELIDERQDRAAAGNLMGRLTTLLREIKVTTDELHPSRAEYDRLVDELDANLWRLANIQPDRAGELRRQSTALREAAENAYTARNRTDWRLIYDRLEGLDRRAYQLITQDSPAREPTPEEVLVFVLEHLDRIEQALRAADPAGEHAAVTGPWNQDIASITREVRAAPQETRTLIDIYHRRCVPLSERINAWLVSLGRRSGPDIRPRRMP